MDNNQLETKYENKLENLSFNPNTKVLKFDLIKYTYKPKIERYIQRNYERIPIYSEYPSISTKNLLKFEKVINPIEYANKLYENNQLLTLDEKIKICNCLNVTPNWLKYINEISCLNNKIKENERHLKRFVEPELHLNPRHYQDTPSTIWWRILLTIFTLGLCWIGFVSEKQAIINKKINEKIKQENDKLIHEHQIKCKKLKADIDQDNASINKIIDNYRKEIYTLKVKLSNVNNISTYQDESGWINLRDSFSLNKDFLKNKKGIYFIWNKTKNKYYVGQSKDLYKRIYTQHFNNGDVKNIIFAKDWYTNDDFYVKWEECETKDELDSKEKHYIEYYDSFCNGYNKTGGNK